VGRHKFKVESSSGVGMYDAVIRILISNTQLRSSAIAMVTKTRRLHVFSVKCSGQWRGKYPSVIWIGQLVPYFSALSIRSSSSCLGLSFWLKPVALFNAHTHPTPVT